MKRLNWIKLPGYAVAYDGCYAIGRRRVDAVFPKLWDGIGNTVTRLWIRITRV